MSPSIPLVSWHPWTDVRRRDDIARLNISFPLGVMTYEWSLKIRQSYYAAVLYVDDLIGELMRYVDRRKTIIVLTSDHGQYFNYRLPNLLTFSLSVNNLPPFVLQGGL